MTRKEKIIAAIGCIADLLAILDIIYWLHKEVTKESPDINIVWIAIGITGVVLALFLANMLHERLKRRRRDHSKRHAPNEIPADIAYKKERSPQPIHTISINLVEGKEQAVEPLDISIRIIFDGVKYDYEG